MSEIKNAALRHGVTPTPPLLSSGQPFKVVLISHHRPVAGQSPSSSPGAAQNDCPSWNENMRQLLQTLDIQYYSFDADVFRGHGTIDQLKKKMIIVQAWETSFINTYCYLEEIIFDKDVWYIQRMKHNFFVGLFVLILWLMVLRKIHSKSSLLTLVKQKIPRSEN